METVRSWMTSPAIVTPQMSVLVVAQLLLDRRIGGVPVLDDGRIVGVVSESDLFRLLVTQQHLALAAQEATLAIP